MRNGTKPGLEFSGPWCSLAVWNQGPRGGLGKSRAKPGMLRGAPASGSPGLAGRPCSCWDVSSARLTVHCWGILSWKCYVVNYTASDLWEVAFRLLQAMSRKSATRHLLLGNTLSRVQGSLLKGGTFIRGSSGALEFLASRCISNAFSLSGELCCAESSAVHCSAVFPCPRYILLQLHGCTWRWEKRWYSTSLTSSRFSDGSCMPEQILGAICVFPTKKMLNAIYLSGILSRKLPEAVLHIKGETKTVEGLTVSKLRIPHRSEAKESPQMRIKGGPGTVAV